MIASEASQVLTLAAGYDGRAVTAENAIAWAEILNRVTLHDALEAVKRHYRTSQKWIMPADIVTGALTVRQQREREAHNALSKTERDWRACNVKACACTHTSCTRGFLDDEETFTERGQTYTGIRRCPKCWDYAQALKAAKEQGW